MILVLSEDQALHEAVRDAVRDAVGGTVEVSAAPLTAGLRAAPQQTDVVIVDGVESLDKALEVAGQYDVERPAVTVVLHAEAEGDTLSRAMGVGVRYLLRPGADASAIRDSVSQALERAERRAQAMREDEATSQHRLILVLSPKGGSGKTTISSNLAVGLASRAPKQVVLVDGDLQFGDVANALRLLAESTVRDAISGGLGDVAEVKVHLTPHRSGLYALCAPEIPGIADEISPQAFAKAVTLLHHEFRYVVVDTDPGLSERTLQVMDHATDFVFVAATDVASVRGLHKTIDALDRIGLTGARRHFVLNRSDARVGLDLDDIAATIGMQPDVLVPSTVTLPVSLNQGTPVLELEEDSPATPALWHLVDRFEPDPRQSSTGATAERRTGGGIFGRR